MNQCMNLNLAAPIRQKSIWQSFDIKVTESQTQRTPNNDAIVEMRQYILAKNIDRNENPLKWWVANKNVYPKLYTLALKYLCIPATSVPAERLKGWRTNIR